MVKIKKQNILSGLKKITRFGLSIPLSNILLVYGNHILPTKMLKSISNWRNKRIEKYINSYIKYPDIKYPLHERGCDKIWVLWLQGEDKMPLIPRMCLRSIRKYAGSHEVVLLSINNLHKYYTLPPRIKHLYEQGNITAAHLSDIIRIGLLSTHGGFWIDSTMFLTKDIDDEIINRDFFSMKSAPEGLYVSECRWAGFCMLMNRGSMLPHILQSMITQYWEKHDWLIDYFMLDYLIDMAVNHYPDVKKLINDNPTNNPQLHALSPLLCSKYDEKLYQHITKNTSFFKLSWKLFSDSELLKHKDNFYNMINAKVL